MVTPPNKFNQNMQPPAKPVEKKAPIDTGATNKISDLKQKIVEKQTATPPPKTPISINRSVSVNNNNNNNSDESADVENKPAPSGRIKELQGKIGGQNNNAPASKQPIDIGYKPDIKGRQQELFGKKEVVVSKVEIASHERAGNMSQLKSNIGKLFAPQGLSVKEGVQLNGFLAQPGMKEKMAERRALLEEQLGHKGEGADPDLDERIALELADYFYAEFLQFMYDNEGAVSMNNAAETENDADIARRLQEELNGEALDPHAAIKARMAQADADMAAKKAAFAEKFAEKTDHFRRTFEKELTGFGYTFHPDTMEFTKTTLGIVRHFTMQDILAKNPKQMPKDRLGPDWE